MPRRAASHDNEPLGVEQLLLVVDNCTEYHIVSIDIHTPTHTVGQTVGLLKDFLEHEMGIASALYLSEINVYGLYFGVQLAIKYIDYVEFLALSYHGNVAVFEINHLVGVFYYGTCVRSEEEFVVADAHHKRALFACCDYLVGVALVQQGYCIGANHLMESQLHGSEQIEVLAFLDIFNQLHEHFRVGVGTKLDAFRHQLVLQIGIILYYSVVDNGEIFRLGVVRVSV